jgi:ATP-dependent Lon protease
MPRDSQTKMSKKESKVSKKRDQQIRKKKQNESSDDDASFYTDDDSENEMDVQEYRKFLKKMFPSKHLDKKIKAGERLKEILDDSDEEEDEDEEEEIKPKKKSKKHIKKSKKIIKKSKKSNIESEDEDEEEEEVKPKKKSKKIINKSKKGKKIVVSDDETEDDDDEEEDLDSEDSETDSDEEDDEDSPKAGKFNIIFTIGGQEDEDEMEDMFEDDEDWETCSDDEDTENEDDPISSDSDTNEDEDEDEEEDDDEYEEDEEEEKPKKNRKVSKKGSKKVSKKESKKVSKKESKSNIEDVSEEDNMLINKLKDVLGVKSSDKKESDEDVVAMLKDLQSRNKNNDLVNECLKVCEEKIAVNKKKQEKKVKKEKARNGRIFKRILRDKNTMNDFEFYDKLETVNQKKIIKELREINKITRIEKPYRLTLLESDIPVIFKAAAMKKISSLRYMEPGSGEFYKIKNWVDTFMRIPFSENKTLPISITDGVDNCHDFMANAQKTLDEAVYGLNDAKMQIMQMLGQLITNPKAIGSAIAIHGPPGTGKTSLVKEGISKILNRPFAFIALGGATDSSFLEGHGYTYEGSTWGKIVQILIDSKCMNPVIYFDELDKISDTPKGEEIAGILTHLTDTSQNTQFHDKYFAEIDFDLSKCLFIFSYNDESKVNPILKDRMYRIQTKGYNQKQKTAISNNYLLPKIREQVKFEAEDIIIPDQTLHYIIENYCNKEDGVRNMKRCLEIIYTKLNLYRLMRPGSNLFEEDMSIKVEFPFTVTKDIVEKLIKKTGNGLDPSLYHLYL